MKYFLLFFQLTTAAAVSGQLLDIDLECPIIYAPAYVVQNGILNISFIQSGGNIKKEVRKHANAVTTYSFESTGVAYMKVITDKGNFTDTFMLNATRCQYKSDPESRFYEPNLFCNDKGMIIANQTEKSNYFYKYDSLDRLQEWIQINHEEDGQSTVALTYYKYDSLERMDSIVEKEGMLKYNLSIRQMDTIYVSTVTRLIRYNGDKMNTVVTYTNNNRDQTVAASTYRYKYRHNELDQIDLYIGDDKKPIYTLKVLKMD